MMTGSSFGACLRISASSAAMSERRSSSTGAMNSAGVFTFSCPFIFIASPQTRRQQTGGGPSALPSMSSRTTGTGALHEDARPPAARVRNRQDSSVVCGEPTDGSDPPLPYVSQHARCVESPAVRPALRPFRSRLRRFREGPGGRLRSWSGFVLDRAAGRTFEVRVDREVRPPTVAASDLCRRGLVVRRYVLR